ncbi:MAG: hypothetical protein EOM26_08555 [Alphaproteobacteria bacterium]|nr:hypothetical protein [Alphaproteobacteria bacterium]
MDSPETIEYLRFAAALLFVLSLMGLLAFFMKKLGLGGVAANVQARKHLKIAEVLPLDSRRRAVLIQRDERQHLVILGPNGETVVETNIEAPKPETGTAGE